MAEIYSPYLETTDFVIDGDSNPEYVSAPILGLPDGAMGFVTSEDSAPRLDSPVQFFSDAEGKEVYFSLIREKQTLVYGANERELNLRIIYPDGSEEILTTNVTLRPSEGLYYEPEYKALGLGPGQSGTTAPSNDFGDALPNSAKFEIGEIYGETGRIIGQDGWSFSIDENTGKLTVSAPPTEARSVWLPVVVTYASGASDYTSVHVFYSGYIQPDVPAEPTTVTAAPVTTTVTPVETVTSTATVTENVTETVTKTANTVTQTASEVTVTKEPSTTTVTATPETVTTTPTVTEAAVDTITVRPSVTVTETATVTETLTATVTPTPAVEEVERGPSSEEWGSSTSSVLGIILTAILSILGAVGAFVALGGLPAGISKIL